LLFSGSGVYAGRPALQADQSTGLFVLFVSFVAIP
jgi:hypothetical protein